MPERLTEEDKRTLKNAAFGAVVLVSQAEPGMLGMVRESYAAAGALTHASPLVREVLGAGGVPELDGASLAEVEATVLPQLREALRILRARAPQEVGNYAETVLAACAKAASGSGRVTGPEREALAKIGAAVDTPTEAG